jgi:hypothetical protein
MPVSRPYPDGNTAFLLILLLPRLIGPKKQKMLTELVVSRRLGTHKRGGKANIFVQ